MAVAPIVEKHRLASRGVAISPSTALRERELVLESDAENRRPRAASAASHPLQEGALADGRGAAFPSAILVGQDAAPVCGAYGSARKVLGSGTDPRPPPPAPSPLDRLELVETSFIASIAEA